MPLRFRLYKAACLASIFFVLLALIGMAVESYYKSVGPPNDIGVFVIFFIIILYVIVTSIILIMMALMFLISCYFNLLWIINIKNTFIELKDFVRYKYLEYDIVDYSNWLLFLTLFSTFYYSLTTLSLIKKVNELYSISLLENSQDNLLN